MLLVRKGCVRKGWDSSALLGALEKVGNEMTKHCEICGLPVKQGQKVHVGVISTFVEVPSQISWAIEKPEQFTFVNHAQCEGLE